MLGVQNYSRGSLRLQVVMKATATMITVTVALLIDTCASRSRCVHSALNGYIAGTPWRARVVACVVV